MSLQVSLLNFALDTVAHLNPEYAPAISWVKSHEAEAGPLMRVIDAAIRQGGSAIAAVRREAPDLAKAITDLVDASQAPQDPKQLEVHSENTARTMFGFPRLTSDEEKSWMDRATPSGDSRDGSG